MNTQIIENVMSNALTPDEQHLIVKALKTDKKVAKALKVNELFLLGHPLDAGKNGAFTLAAKALGCSVSSCQRNYNKLYPSRSVVIEKPIKPALVFPMKRT